MPNPNPETKSADPTKTNANAVTGAVIVGAILLAFVGTMLPGWAGMTGPEATWIPLVFYALAVADVAIAFYLRSLIKKAQRNNAAGSTIQRR